MERHYCWYSPKLDSYLVQFYVTYVLTMYFFSLAKHFQVITLMMLCFIQQKKNPKSNQAILSYNFTTSSRKWFYENYVVLNLRKHFSKAVAQRCSVKKVFLEISQNSQENTCARVSFLIKLQAAFGGQITFGSKLIRFGTDVK